MASSMRPATHPAHNVEAEANPARGQAAVHLRENARRMRFHALLALFIMLVAVVLAFVFIGFVGSLDRTINIKAEAGSHVAIAGPAVDWSVLLARLVIAGLLLVLVRILAGMYRYSIRMAALFEDKAATVAGAELYPEETTKASSEDATVQASP
jgi:hypothetical protein